MIQDLITQDVLYLKRCAAESSTSRCLYVYILTEPFQLSSVSKEVLYEDFKH